MKVQLNSNLTITNSKSFSKEEKSKILGTSEGKSKAIRATFVDAKGKTVVLQGRLYESTKGSLTARANVKLENCEIVEIEDAKEESLDSLRNKLGLV
jgi:hypothetical protein